MHGIVCDRCGEPLLVEEDVRYVLKLEIAAAYDPMEVTAADLSRDLDAEYRAAIREAEQRSAEELSRQVHFSAAYDLCPRCRADFLADPLFRSGG